MPVHHRDRKPWFHWLKWGDYLIYILVTLAAVMLMFQFPSPSSTSDERKALILVDGQVFREFSAAELQAGGSLVFDAHDLHYTVEYAKGNIRISQADCPDQVCVQTGWVSRQGQLAACVPGHVILKVQGSVNQSSETSDEVDVVIR